MVLASGKVVRSAVAEVPAKGRDTMGVVFARMTGDDRILAVARNSERGIDEEDETDAETAESPTPESPIAEAESSEVQAAEAESPEES